MFSTGSVGGWKRKVNPRRTFLIGEAKTSLKGGIKESEKVSEDDPTQVVLRHGEVCVKGEALEEVNEME